MKLFCIPHAGGLIASFVPLKRSLLGIVEVIGIELAGRGVKEKLPFYNTFMEAVYDVATDISEHIWHSPDEPYIILGHSMGSWLAYEVYYQLRLWGVKGPEHVIFSGNNTPPTHFEEQGIHNLTDEKIIESILELGYTNSEIFSNPRFRNMFLPYLKSDLEITACYAADLNRPSLDCDITVLYGLQDPLITEDVRRWGWISGGTCQLRGYEGGHFFIYEKTDEIALVVKQIIARIV